MSARVLALARDELAPLVLATTTSIPPGATFPEIVAAFIVHLGFRLIR